MRKQEGDLYMRKENVLRLGLCTLMVMSSAVNVHAASSITYLTNVGSEDLTGDGIKDVTKTVERDLDGDGQRETVTFKATYNNGYYTSLTATINDEERTLIDNSELKSNDGFDLCFVKMAKGKEYLQVLSDDDHDEVYLDDLYQYHSDTKSFKKVTSLLEDELTKNAFTVYDGSVYNVKKNSFKVKSIIQPIEVGYVGLNVTYTYKKGKLVRDHTTTSFTGNTKRHFITCKTLTLNKTRTSKKTFKVKKNKTVKLVKAYVAKGKISLCFKSGKKTGWKEVTTSKNQVRKDYWFKNTKSNFM